MTRSLLLIATPVLLALSACTTAAPPMPEPAMSDPNPSATATCNPEAAKARAMGKTATAAVVEQARMDAGARTARVIKPDMMVTMEYEEGRLNVDVDKANVITNLRCG